MVSEAPESAARSAALLHLPISANLSQSETPEPDLDPRGKGCPNNPMGYAYVNNLTGEVVPWRCARNTCDYCVQGNARRRALAIAYAKPERAILLTQVGNDWATVQARLNRLRHAIVKELEASFEWVWHVEPNPQGTGHHVHAWQRGVFIPQKDLARIADSKGLGGVAFINKIRNPLQSANYGLKGLGYGLKGIATDSRSTYLRVNGGRLTHQSRGFFVDSDGQRVGVREAERLAASVGREEVGKWTLIAMPSALPSV
jgi:hypothetical protein